MTHNEPPIRLLRRTVVQERTGLSRSTIYSMLADGKFPEPVNIGPRAVGWIESEIDEWIAERIHQSRGAA